MKRITLGIIITVLCLPLVPLLIHQFSTGDSAAAQHMIDQYVTFYTWLDNDPPGPAIAYPHSRHPGTVHEVAGGTGTYADPITIASDPTEWAVGTRMYAPFLGKYLVMEDQCEQCMHDWRQFRKHHIDIWMNSNSASGAAVQACARHWTRELTAIEINPPRDRPVDARPLFDTVSRTCLANVNLPR
jgi:3D (Asp-Asp-Asp) domain-containing protein